jgi:beta-catenin-like protein 1
MSEKRARASVDDPTDVDAFTAGPSTSRASKRPALDASFFDRPGFSSAAPADGAALLAEAETRAGIARAPDGEHDHDASVDASDDAIDAKTVRRLVLAFERAYAENVKARAKYGDDPRKFAESEIELDAEVKKLGQLASAPELYVELVELNAVPSLVAVLGHENEDVVADALDVLRELTDGDAVESDEAGGNALADAFRANGGYIALYAALIRFENEDGTLKATSSEASDAVSAALAVVENLGEIKGTKTDDESGELTNDALEGFCEETELLSWLMRRVGKKRAVDQNKLYASELLSIIVQSSAKCRKRCVEMNGLDGLLQAVSAYKKREPEDDGERELVENLFDAMCALAMVPENKASFIELEGVELMLILLRGVAGGGDKGDGKKSGANFAAVPALKCLDYVLSGNASACARFVDASGLKSVFSVFMGRNAKAVRKAFGNEAVLEQETRSCSIVCSLFKNLVDADRRDRLCAKFVEQDFAKCDRLVELWVEFAKRVSAEQTRLDAEDADDVGIERTEEDEYLQKLDAGLATLEHLTLVFAHLWSTDHAPIMRRLYVDASQNAITLAHLRDILRQHAHHVGDSAGDAVREDAVRAVLRILPYAPHERDADADADAS